MVHDYFFQSAHIKILLFLVSVLSLSSPFYGQEVFQKQDSLLLLSDKKFEFSKEMESIAYAYQVMQWADNNNNSEFKAKSYYKIGRAMFSLEMNKSSLYFFNEVLQETYIKTDPILEVKTRENLAINYLHNGWQDQYFVELQKAENILDTLNSFQLMDDKYLLKMRIALNLGNYYSITKNLDSLKKYMRRADRYADSLLKPQRTKEYNDYLLLKGGYYQHIHQSDSALIFLDSSLNNENDYIKKFPHFYYLGEFYFNEQNYKLALSNYLKSLDIIEKQTANWSLYPNIYNQLGRTYLKLNDTIKANYHSKKYEEVLDSISKLKNERSIALFDKLRKVSEVPKSYEENKDSNITSKNLLGCVIIALTGFLFYFFLMTRANLKKITIAKEKETMQLKNQLNQAFEEVIIMAKNNDSTFLKRFEEVYSDFYRALMKQHPNLTISDKKFCAMIYLKFDTKEIAKYTFIEHRSVQKKKSRLRKKMGLTSEENFYDYLTKINDEHEF